jgi:hypothetical protein
MSDPMTYSDFFDAAKNGLELGPDRHPKWQRVEPGTVIPAGQPYRIEFANDSPCTSTEWIQVGFAREAEGDDVEAWFVDSSWRPPLELPTEPTWGIAVRRDERPDKGAGDVLGIGHRWWVDGEVLQGDLCCWGLGEILDFIPLTDEQVQRIEAAR